MSNPGAWVMSPGEGELTTRTCVSWTVEGNDDKV